MAEKTPSIQLPTDDLERKALVNWRSYVDSISPDDDTLPGITWRPI